MKPVRVLGVALALAAGCLRSFDVREDAGSVSGTPASSGSGGSSAGGGGAGGGTPENCQSPKLKSYVEEVMADHPIAYYRFEAFDGKTAVPEVGPPGLAKDVKASSLGAVGSAGSIELDILDGYVNFGAAAFQVFGVTPVTFELWINPSKGDWMSDQFPFLLTKEDNLRTGVELIANQTGVNSILWEKGDAEMGFATAFADIPTHAWTHVVLVVNPVLPEMVAYLNGMAAGGATKCNLAMGSSCPSFENGGPLVVGGAPGHGSPYIGLVDELAVYQGALPDDRICIHHRAGVESM